MDYSLVEGVITCGICLKKFNGKFRCPRILTCGHSFCHSCLEKLIEQNPRCHTCCRYFRFKSPVSIPINFSLRRLTNVKARAINLPEREPMRPNLRNFSFISLPNIKTEAIGSTSTTKSARALDLQEEETIGSDPCASKRQRTKGKSFLSEGHCEEHNTYVGMRCMDCKLWICGMCAALKHKHCWTLVVEEAYIELKKQLSQKVETELVKRKETFVKLDEKINKTKQELKDRENKVRELETLKSDGMKLCQNLKQLQGLVESSVAGGELSKAIYELKKFLEEQKMEIPDDKPLLPIPLSIKQLENWCSTGSVYAEEDRFDGTKYGKVTVKDGRILVHNFQPEKPQARIIPFKELLSKFGASTELPNTAFLRLTPTVGTKGFDVLIKTDGTSPRAKNFLLLCSALKGPTYKGTRMKVATFSNANTGTSPIRSTSCQLLQGPAPVTDGITNFGNLLPVKKGSVYGMGKDNSGLMISLGDHPSYLFCEFGTVVSGLQELSKQKRPVVVSDCGLVI